MTWSVWLSLFRNTITHSLKSTSGLIHRYLEVKYNIYLFRSNDRSNGSSQSKNWM